MEEQFYLLWPALLLVLARSLRVLLITCGLLAMLSVIGTLVYYPQSPDTVFYMLPFRLHQLLMGALLALISLSARGMLANSLTVLGLTILFTAIIAFNAERPPALGALVITAAGALLLLGRDSAAATHLLTHRVLQWFGRRSYAIYLVHWPLIVLWKYAFGFELNATTVVCLIALSLLGAVAVHEGVEKRLRKTGPDTTYAQRHALAITISGVITAAGLSLLILVTDVPGKRTPPEITQLLDSIEAQTEARRQAIRYGVCGLHKEHRFDDYDEAACAALAPDKPNVLVIGDSIAADTYMMLRAAYPEIHFSQATAGACQAFLPLQHAAAQYETCQTLNRFRFETLIQRDYDAIIIASVWKPQFVNALKGTLPALEKRAGKLLVFGPRAVFPGGLPTLVGLQTRLDGINVRLHANASRNADLLASLERLSGPDLIVDIARVQCEPLCTSVHEGKLLYLDALHMTPEGAQFFAPRLRKHLDLIAFTSETREDAR